MANKVKVSSKPKKALASYSGAGPKDWKNWGPNRRRQHAKGVYDQNSKATGGKSDSWDDLTKDQQDWIIANDEPPRGGVQHRMTPKDYPDWWYSDDKTNPDNQEEEKEEEKDEDDGDDGDDGEEEINVDPLPEDKQLESPPRKPPVGTPLDSPPKGKPKGPKDRPRGADRMFDKKRYDDYGLYSEPKKAKASTPLTDKWDLNKKDHEDYTPDGEYEDKAKVSKPKTSKPKASKPKASKPATASAPKQRYTSRGKGNYIRS